MRLVTTPRRSDTKPLGRPLTILLARNPDYSSGLRAGSGDHSPD